MLTLQTAEGFTWTSPEGVTGFVRAALPDSPAALPTERNSHAAVAVDRHFQEMCMIDTENQVNALQVYFAVKADLTVQQSAYTCLRCSTSPNSHSLGCCIAHLSMHEVCSERGMQ